MRLAFILVGLIVTPALAADWPQWLGPQRDAIWDAPSLIEKFPPGGPAVVWRQPIGEGYAGPAVVAGKIYLADRIKKDADPAKPGILQGTERIQCLDAANGKPIWTHEYDCPYAKVSYPSGPRTTPVVEKDRLYILGTMGDLLCLNPVDGKVIWSKNFPKNYSAPIPAWGWSAHLLVDGDKLIALVGGPKQAVVAFDKTTGTELWKSGTTKEIGYAPPIVIEAGGTRQLIVWLSEAVYSLNPESGAEFWKQPHPGEGEPARPAVSIITPKLAGDKLLVSSFYHGILALTLGKDKPTAEVAWRSKNSYPKEIDGLNTVMTSLLVKDGHVYGIAGMGAIICQKLATGEVVRTGQEIFGDKDAFCGTVFWVDAGPRVYGLTDQGDFVILKLSPEKCEVLDTAHVLEPTHAAKGRKAIWSHPAFVGDRVYLKNDKEIVCLSLAKR